jgi:hypothetical protein
LIQYSNRAVNYSYGCAHTQKISDVKKGHILVLNGFSPDRLDGFNDTFRPINEVNQRSIGYLRYLGGCLIYSEVGDNLVSWNGKK